MKSWGKEMKSLFLLSLFLCFDLQRTNSFLFPSSSSLSSSPFNGYPRASTSSSSSSTFGNRELNSFYSSYHFLSSLSLSSSLFASHASSDDFATVPPGISPVLNINESQESKNEKEKEDNDLTSPSPAPPSLSPKVFVVEETADWKLNSVEDGDFIVFEIIKRDNNIEQVNAKDKEVLAELILYQEKSKNKRKVEISDLEVSEFYQGQGFAKLLLDVAVEYHLNQGGRIHELHIEKLMESENVSTFFSDRGFRIVEEEKRGDEVLYSLVGDLEQSLQYYEQEESQLLQEKGDGKEKEVKKEIESESENHQNQLISRKKGRFLNILGRLHHAKGSFQKAIDSYTTSLTAFNDNFIVFQHLGSAYAAIGESQMAFASFQRAIDLNPENYYTYFKLAMLYEEIGKGKYKDGIQHAMKCYEFYLNSTNYQDTDAMTMYGNLLQKNLFPEEAIEIYTKIVEKDPNLYNVWFNMANAYLMMQNNDDAIECLKMTLEINPIMTSASHLLSSLDSSQARLDKKKMDENYIRDLFDYYSMNNYDKHMKDSLFYTGPRLMRQQIRCFFNETLSSVLFSTENNTKNQIPIPALTAYLNKSLNVLDVGCGTGLCGAWFTDYSNHLVGLDLSPKSVEIAKKKIVYDELYVSSITSFLHAATATATSTPTVEKKEAKDGDIESKGEEDVENYEKFFDLVVMGDVVNYLGENMDTTLASIAPLLSSTISPAFKEVSDDLQNEINQLGIGEGSSTNLFDSDPTTSPLSRQKIGGLVTFTVDELQLSDVESMEDIESGYILTKNGIFVYTKKYIDNLLEKNNYIVESCRKVSYRVERGVPVPGYIYVCRQKRTSSVV